MSNIYVVSDPENKDNEGKVFLYQYGKKIFDKIMDAMKPEFEDEDPLNPFDLWEGANFKIKIRQVEGWRNYDKSEFDKPSALLDGDDEKLKEVYEDLLPLDDYLDPKQYKSYNVLLKKLNAVIGETVIKESTEESDTKVSHDAPAPKEDVSDEPMVLDEDDDPDMDSFFEKLAKEE